MSSFHVKDGGVVKRHIFADTTNVPQARRQAASKSKQTPTSATRPRSSSSTAATSLRALAIRVATQLKRSGPCSYADVADALVREGASTVEAMSVRRRVNDALNVLVAAGAVTRSPSPERIIAWNWVFGAEEAVRDACDKVVVAREKVLAARERRDRMEQQVRAFESIVQRNAERAVEGTDGSKAERGDEKAIKFPFVLVAMEHKNASCYATAADQNRSDVTVSMGAPFQILDDCAVLERVAQLPSLAEMPSPVVTWPGVSHIS